MRNDLIRYNKRVARYQYSGTLYNTMGGGMVYGSNMHKDLNIFILNMARVFLDEG